MTKAERAEMLRKLEGFTERQRKRSTKRRKYFRRYLAKLEASERRWKRKAVAA